MAFGIGVYVFALAAQYILRPAEKQEELTDPWENLDFPEAEPGSPIPVVFGTRWLNNANVVWWGDLRARSVRIKQGSLLPFGVGDKKINVNTKQYYGMHMAICQYPIDAIQKIKAGDIVIYDGDVSGDITASATKTIDYPDAFGGPKQDGGVTGDVDIEFGDPAQTANAYLISQLGADIPAFRGTVCAVLNQMHLSAGKAEVRPWSFLVQWLDSNACGPNSLDMNPAHMIQLATTEKWGLDQDSADLDTASFTAAKTQLDTEAIGLSLAWQTGAPVQRIIKDVLNHIMGVYYVDPETGKFTLKLMRQGDSSVLSIDESNILQMVNYQRPSLSELTNQVTVHYKDRNFDTERTVTLQNQGLIEQMGGVINSQDLNYDMVVEPATAQQIAARDLRNLSTSLSLSEVICNREALGVRMGDVVTLTWPRYSVTAETMRVMAIDYGNLQNGEIRLQLIQDIYGVDTSLNASPPASKFVVPYNEPADATNRLVFEVPYNLLAQRLGSTSTVWDEVAIDAGWIMAAIEKPSSDSITFELWTRLTADAYDEEDDISPFTPTATLDAALTPEVTTSTTITEVHDLDLVETEQYCIIGTEICEVTAIDAGAGTVTLKRGIMDTVPQDHAQDALVYFCDTWAAEDPTEYASADVVKSKALPMTSLGVLDIGDATEDTTTLDDRLYRPYPPGKFQLNTAYWPLFISGALTVTWAHRDRVTQATEYTLQSAADVGPEAGTTYTVKIWDEEDDLIVNQSGIATTSYALTIDDEITLSALAAGARPNETMRILVSSQRDGFDSWQEQDYTIPECRGYGMFYGDYYGE